jgi:hypothetical protein
MNQILPCQLVVYCTCCIWRIVDNFEIFMSLCNLSSTHWNFFSPFITPAGATAPRWPGSSFCPTTTDSSQREAATPPSCSGSSPKKAEEDAPLSRTGRAPGKKIRNWRICLKESDSRIFFLVLFKIWWRLIGNSRRNWRFKNSARQRRRNLAAKIERNS